MLTAERAPGAPQDHVPRGTTPTWEMELLLSGATVFGLLQVPGTLDPWFYSVFQRADEGLAPNLMATWMYVKGAILTLSATFVLHLALRAYWVALVGMRSVYPGGLVWDRLRAGPVQRKIMAPVASDLAARVEAADNRATRVFAVGVAIAFVLLVPLALVLAGIALTMAIRAAGGPDLGRWALAGAVLVALGPFLAASALDRRRGAGLAEGGLGFRVLGGVFRAYDRIGFGAASNPILALFQSHEGFARTMVVSLTTMVTIFLVVVMQFASAMGEDGPWGDFAGLPARDPGAQETLLPEHYATQRRPDQVVALPYVQDRVVRGPYVELFVPYRPGRHAPALRESCGEAVAVADSGGPPAEALACLARLLDLRLDGAPVGAPLQATEDPLTGMPGVLAMIPAAELASGRHVLTVRRLPRPGRKEPEPFRIPFWR